MGTPIDFVYIFSCTGVFFAFSVKVYLFTCYHNMKTKYKILAVF